MIYKSKPKKEKPAPQAADNKKTKKTASQPAPEPEPAPVSEVAAEPAPGLNLPNPALAEAEAAPAKTKKKAALQVVPDKPKVTNINKRITEGARIDTWRVARSLRVGMPGYFAQGGHYQATNRGNSFIVGEEKHFSELRAAQEYANSRLPTAS